MKLQSPNHVSLKQHNNHLPKAEKARVRRSMAYHEIEKLRIEAQQETCLWAKEGQLLNSKYGFVLALLNHLYMREYGN